jgi:hypothetical protein
MRGSWLPLVPNPQRGPFCLRAAKICQHFIVISNIKINLNINNIYLYLGQETNCSNHAYPKASTDSVFFKMYPSPLKF